MLQSQFGLGFLTCDLGSERDAFTHNMLPCASQKKRKRFTTNKQTKKVGLCMYNIDANIELYV